MKLLAILILFVEAGLARGWVGLVTSDKADNREMWWKNTRSVNMRDVREGRRMKNIPGQLIATRGSDTDTDTTRDREGLQCLQEELLLCTDQLTSTLQRCNIFSWACRNKKTKKCHWVPESPTKYFRYFNWSGMNVALWQPSKGWTSCAGWVQESYLHHGKSPEKALKEKILEINVY